MTRAGAPTRIAIAALLAWTACSDPAEAPLDAAPDGASDAAPDAAPDAAAMPDLRVVDGNGQPVAMVMFSPTAIGQSSRLAVKIANSGTVAMRITSITITGDFALASMDCQGATLAPAAQCNVELAFVPMTTGPLTGTLGVQTDAGTFSFPLVGEGLVEQLQLAPASIVFGQVEGGTSRTQTVELQNVGTTPMPIDVIGMDSTASGFTVSSSTCGAQLAAGATCNIVVAFSPTAIGAASASLRVVSLGTIYDASAAGVGAGRITIARNGAGSGSVASVPAGIDCGTTCTALFVEPVTLTATPSVTSQVGGWSVAGCAGTTCTVTPTLAPRTVTATFAPSSAITLTASADWGTIDLTGPLGEAQQIRTVELANTTSSTIPIDRIDLLAPFTMFENGCGLAVPANASCTFKLKFEAPVGEYNGAFKVTLDNRQYISSLHAIAARPVTVTLQGEGRVTSSPAGIDCGTNCRGLFHAAVTLTATPASGYEFAQWEPALCPNPTCSVSPGTTIKALFAASTQTALNITFAGGGLGEVRVMANGTQRALCSRSCSAAIAAGETVRIVAGTSSDYAGMTGACAAGAATNTCEYVASGSGALTVMFTKPEAERFTRVVPGQGSISDVTFDSTGNLILFSSGTMTKLDETGAIVWARSLAVTSHLRGTAGDLYVTAGGNLLHIASDGTTQSSYALDGTLQWHAPNGNFLGTGPGGLTEWTRTGAVVRTIPLSNITGVDETGTFYQSFVKDSTIGAPEDFPAALDAHRWSFDGAPMTDFGTIVESEYGSQAGTGVSIAYGHVIGTIISRSIGRRSPYVVRSSTLAGVEELAFGGVREETFVALPVYVQAAGPSAIGVYTTLDDYPSDCAFSLSLYQASANGWSAAFGLSRWPLSDDGSWIGMCGERLVAGPNGELAIVGKYTHLIDYANATQPTSSIVQVFKP